MMIVSESDAGGSEKKAEYSQQENNLRLSGD